MGRAVSYTPIAHIILQSHSVLNAVINRLQNYLYVLPTENHNTYEGYRGNR